MKKCIAFLLMLTIMAFVTACGEKVENSETLTVKEIVEFAEAHKTQPDPGKLTYVVENYTLKDYLKKYEEKYGENPLSVILWYYGIGELHKHSVTDGNGGILECYSLEELCEEKYSMSLLGYILENYSAEEVIGEYLNNDPECLDDFIERETGE